MSEHVFSIITGGAFGIDTLAERLAHRYGYRVHVFLPPYQRYSAHTSSTIVRMTPSMQAEGKSSFIIFQ